MTARRLLACAFSIAVTLAFCARALTAQRTGTIRGKVLDPAGQPIEGAQVLAQPSSHRVVSAEDGGFALVDLQVGSYTLTVRRIGYQQAKRDIELHEGTTVTTISMVPIPRQLDSVRIRAKTEGFRFTAAVVDQNNMPVTGAEVVAMGIDNKIVTDTLGRFTIPKLFKGTLAIRIRKIGYAAYSDSYRMLSERADTLRMLRLAATLSAIEINEQSGFGNDYWAYREMDQRARWKGAMAGVVSREELDAQGKTPICSALMFTPTGGKYGMHCGIHVLLNGAWCDPVRQLFADEVETVEYFPRKSDLSGSLAARRCGPPTIVVWLRKDAKRAP